LKFCAEAETMQHMETTNNTTFLIVVIIV